jgi:hypothetical protein
MRRVAHPGGLVAECLWDFAAETCAERAPATRDAA